MAVGPDALAVGFGGLDVFLCLSAGVEIPWVAVVDARVVPFRTARAEIGWRVGGGYFPGWFATGWYTVPGVKGARQLWRVYRGDELLVVETLLARPRRLVLQVRDPVALGAEINARAGGQPRWPGQL